MLIIRNPRDAQERNASKKGRLTVADLKIIKKWQECVERGIILTCSCEFDKGRGKEPAGRILRGVYDGGSYNRMYLLPEYQRAYGT